ncbi:hypothetical protein SEVIR_2G224100v4 [Setaria viridis]|uniref:Bifunctional inhibitor/plant lipid transfer protein/seed storage helical domain-containing protein n=1 Tax=Setaria viridis TaxID=4556 RepID=A0A4U6VTP9_SETVI|nr:50 kDa gamma-zein-like [Setaria viridis]TKW33290.1 hypothetical protein SEVIR_2G224100v2 [Setaria viridis]
MKDMLVVLALMALIASVASMQMGACTCGHQQDHEKHQPQQHHHHQQQHHHQVHMQQQHHQQQYVHVQQQPQQQNHEQPQQQHHQQYQIHEHEVPLQRQHKQPNHQSRHYLEQQPQQQQQQLCQQGFEQQPGQQDNKKQQIKRCGYNTYISNQNLNNCREFLRQQCNPLAMPFLQSRLLQPSNCQVLQQHCCHELRQIEPQYLHQAICNIVQSITHQQQQQEKQQQQQHSCELCGSQQASEGELAIRMVAQHLPSMCGIYHSWSQDSTCGNKDARGVRN